MKTLKLLAFFLALTACAATYAIQPIVMSFSAVDENDPSQIGVSVGEIDNRISALSAREKDGTILSEEKESLADYRDIQENNRQILKNKEELDRINEFVNLDLKRNTYLDESREFFKRLDQDRNSLEKLAPADLHVLITQYTLNRETFASDYAKVKKSYDYLSTHIKDVTAKSGDLSGKIIDNNNKLQETNVTVNESLGLRLRAQNARYASDIGMIQYALNNSDSIYANLNFILSLKHKMLTECAEFLEELSAQQKKLRNRELQETREQVGENIRTSGEHPALSLLSAENNELQQSIDDINRENNDYVKKNEQLTKWIELSQKFESDIENQIRYFKGTVYLVKILLDPDNINYSFSLPRDFVDKLSRYQLQNYNTKTKVDQISEFNNDILETYRDDFAKNEKLEDLVRQSLKLRGRLLNEQYILLNSITRNAMSLEINAESYEKVKNSLQMKIENAMFWNPSNPRFSWQWFRELSDNFASGSLVYMKAAKLMYPVIPPAQDIAGVIFFLCVLALSVGASRYLDRKKTVLTRNVNKVTKTGYTDSLVCILADLTYSFRYFVITAILGLVVIAAFRYHGYEGDFNEIRRSIFCVNMFVSLVIFLSAFFIRLYSENGVNSRHFGVAFDRSTYRSLVRVFVAICVMSSLVMWRLFYPRMFSNDQMGQLVTILLSAWMAIELAVLFVKKYGNDDYPFRKKFVLAIGAVTCLTIVVITYLGYYYSAVRICEKFIVSFYIVLIYDLLRSLIKRILRVYGNKQRLKSRLADIEQQRKRQAESERDAAEGKENDDDIDEFITDNMEVMSAFKVSEQTVTLVDNVFILVLFVIIYQIWGDLLTVTSYLNNYILYNVGTGDSARAITLFDMLIIFYSIVLSVIAFKNMPGAIQVLILNRFESLQKYGYSVTTIISYLLVVFSVLFCASRAGIGWDNVQWLVAALSVGLGFGLQEIFANFVSGLIILFERPVRIGDVITINNHSGTVSRIRIRATTIIDFDLKEYVVPNRSLITSDLTNWTLLNTVTRVTVVIGVGYGSDLEMVKKLLYEIADRNPYVMDSPAPRVYVVNFGESNIDINLYVYTAKTQDRYPCMDSLNLDIFRTFNEHGIEIAFNQMDVYIKNLNTNQELKIS